MTSTPSGPAPADVRGTVVSRLRRVCADWPPEQFAALITDVVRFHERWDVWDTPSMRYSAGTPALHP